MTHSLIEFALLAKSLAEIAVGLSEVGGDLQGLLVVRDRLVESSLAVAVQSRGCFGPRQSQA